MFSTSQRCVYIFESLFALCFTKFLITFVTYYLTNMNTRLKQFLSAENITQAQFADNINVVRASVSHVLSGRNNPSYEFIRSVMLKYPLLNIEWLMFGKGKMYKDSQPQDDTRAENLLFPEQDPYTEKNEIPAYIETEETESPAVQVPEIAVSQRKVSKIIVLFDDGSYQEM